MTYAELVSYVSEQTQEGVSALVLREQLMEAGWREADITNALHDVAAGLHPATPGVSIHADLAQVRGMVAHLAGRVKVLEARLAVAPALELPMQKELPLAHHSSFIRHLAALAIGFVVFLELWLYGSWVPMLTTLIGGLVLLLIGYLFMRRGYAWPASLVIDMGVALLALTTWVAYADHQVMEWTTALALAVLLSVLLVVMERWVDRLARS